MNIAKKFFVLFFVSMQFIIPPEVVSAHSTKESFFYGDIGLYNMCFIPWISGGLGYRYQQEMVGLDLSIDVSTFFVANIIRLSPAFLFYPSPNSVGQGYMGISCGALYMNSTNVYRNRAPWEHYIDVLPECIVGYQFQKASGKNRFIELRLGMPVRESCRERDLGCGCCDDLYCRKFSDPKWVVASVRYGISF